MSRKTQSRRRPERFSTWTLIKGITLHHTATHCNTLQHTATHCNTLPHTATHCNTLQHTATHYICSRQSPQVCVRMCTCMCMYVRKRVRVCAYACVLHVQLLSRINTNMFKSTNVCVCAMYVSIYLYVCMYICMSYSHARSKHATTHCKHCNTPQHTATHCNTHA